MFSRQALAKSASLAFGRRTLAPKASSCLLVSGGGYPTSTPAAPSSASFARRYLSFTFAGPRTLDEVIKKDLLENKTGAEISDIWYTYHESRENVHGLVYEGKDAKDILSRAGSCPFFIQPIFRDDGFFMLISQFQGPSHFLMAYLEDFKMDPSAAQPLMTFSIFDDYAESKDLTLVRCDVLNRGIHDSEGRKIVENVVESYKSELEYATVQTFNQRPDSFDVDDFIARQNEKWQKDPPSVLVK